MLRRRLYLQICALFTVSLVSFVLIATLISSYLGNDAFNDALYQRTTSLAELLLPEPNSRPEAYQKRLQELSDKLKFRVSVYDVNRYLISSSHEPDELPAIDLQSSVWTPTRGDATWSTQLPDGRFVTIRLDRASVPSDEFSFAVFITMLTLTLAAVTYPFIRRLTRKLERLQSGVEKIGAGYLGARVEVEGDDEVASLAKSFNAAAEQIEKLVAAQRLLLASASHELRTPLARIRLGLEMMKGGDVARRNELQQDIKELDSLIDELILMARLDMGLSHHDFEVVDLLALVAEECARYRNCPFEGEPSLIEGDAKMLRHLVRNLIDNAFKHGKEPVTVSISVCEAGVNLRVSDAGFGIMEEDKERVFQPFYRSKSINQPVGYGLGLSMVKKIAEAHGASINLNSRTKSEVCVTFSEL